LEFAELFHYMGPDPDSFEEYARQNSVRL